MDQLDHITVTVISLPVSLLVSHQLDGMCASGEPVVVGGGEDREGCTAGQPEGNRRAGASGR